MRDTQLTIPPPEDKTGMSLGQRCAESIARTVGSWRFIIIQSVILALWVIFNLSGNFERWDPYPFILLNLFLSMQAAYTAPMILMSQNRQSEKDRNVMYGDYLIDKKSHQNIKDLQKKVENCSADIQKILKIIETNKP